MRKAAQTVLVVGLLTGEFNAILGEFLEKHRLVSAPPRKGNAS